MLHFETIQPDTLDLLKRIQSLDTFAGIRLVGGTALALQLGHRKSIDLDFFGSIESSLEDLVSEMSGFAKVSPVSQTKMMRFMIVDGVKVDVVNYPYDWIEEPVVEDGVVLAGIKDIAAMKISAITNRGTRKDFVDLFFLLRHYSFDEIIGFYLQKYSDAQLFTTMKSLTYFEDAEEDPMPLMLEFIEWADVKAKITEAVNSFSK